MAIVDAAVAVGSAVGLGTGTAALIGGGALMGAGAGGLYGALSGGSILKDAGIGGLLGAGGAYGATALGAGAAGGAAQSALAAPMIQGGIFDSAAGGAAASGATNPTITAAANSTTDPIAAMNTSQGWTGTTSPVPGMSTSDYNSLVNTPIGGPADSNLLKYAGYGLGAAALGKAIQSSNAKYGTLTPSQLNTSTIPYASNVGTYQPLNTSIYKPMPAAGTPLYAAEGGIMEAPGYASGGIMGGVQPAPAGSAEQFARTNAVGNNQMFPQSTQNTQAYSSPVNSPVSNPVVGMARGGIAKRYNGQDGSQVQQAAYDPNQEIITQEMVDRMSGMPQQTAPTASAGGGLMQSFANGGTPHSDLGSYSDGGRMLKGPGDGMSDNIPAVIGNKQPARLADGEFVVPADVVSHLGNGSTDAGAKHLYNMMDRVRKARVGTKKQGKEIKAEKFLPK